MKEPQPELAASIPAAVIQVDKFRLARGSTRECAFARPFCGMDATHQTLSRPGIRGRVAYCRVCGRGAVRGCGVVPVTGSRRSGSKSPGDAANLLYAQSKNAYEGPDPCRSREMTPVAPTGVDPVTSRFSVVAGAV
jgi:hypothetical protein